MTHRVTDHDGKEVGYRADGYILHYRPGESSCKLFFPGDIHYDSEHCDHDLLRRHFDRCAELGAGIVINGDLFDAMQGRNDKRRSNRLSMAHWREIVDRACKFLLPYKEHIVAIGHGNHETAVDQYSQVQLLHDLAQELGGVPIMGYQWWISLQLKLHGSNFVGAHIYLHHGFGGANRVGKGVHHFGYRAQTHHADVYVMGHTHTASMHPITVERLDKSNRGLIAKQRLGWAIRPSTYKRLGAWEKEKGFDPPPLGGTLLTFEAVRCCRNAKDTVGLEITPEGWYAA